MTARLATRLALTLAAALGVSAVAGADKVMPDDATRPAGKRLGWGKRTAQSVAEAQYRALVDGGDAYLLEARQVVSQSGQVQSGAGDAAARAALAAYDAALALRLDPDVYYSAFIATQYLHESSPDKWRLVVYYFDGLRAVAPLDSRETLMLSEVCTAAAKLGAQGGPDALEWFARGVAEYETWRRRIDENDARYSEAMSVYSTNAAELVMALGPDQLDKAIEYYETGMAYNDFEPLGYYGAAVAYDRDGQYGKAAELMRDALARDPKPHHEDKRAVNHMARLSDAGVYFVPDGDIDYYRALGYQVQGDAKLAIQHYQQFLASLPRSPYAARAREHLAELGKP